MYIEILPCCTDLPLPWAIKVKEEMQIFQLGLSNSTFSCQIRKNFKTETSTISYPARRSLLGFFFVSPLHDTARLLWAVLSSYESYGVNLFLYPAETVLISLYHAKMLG